MPYRLVQQGEGNPRPLVVLYLVGSPLDPELREALGKTASIAAYDDPNGEGLPATISRVQAETEAAVSDVILVGYSAGCKAIRRELMNGQDVAGILAIDGTHANLPPADWQIEVWQKYAERARQCERLFVATCTQNTYVETALPQGQRYSATVSVLRQVTGYALEPSDDPAGEHDGALHVYSFSSAPTDSPAHAKQQTIVLPVMLARHAKPWLEGQREPAQSSEDPFMSVLSAEERTMVEQAVLVAQEKLMRELGKPTTEKSRVEGEPCG